MPWDYDPPTPPPARVPTGMAGAEPSGAERMPWEAEISHVCETPRPSVGPWQLPVALAALYVAGMVLGVW